MKAEPASHRQSFDRCGGGLRGNTSRSTRRAKFGQNQSFRNLTQIAREWAFKASGRTMRLDYGECACELESVAGPLWR
jgi:hypothetical protein